MQPVAAPGPDLGLTTPGLAGDPDVAVRDAIALFRGLHLEAALALCNAAVAAAAGGTDSEATLARAAYWGARCARRLERPDEALRLLYAGLAAVHGPHGRTECMLRAELTHTLSALGQNEEALGQADAALQRAKQLQDAHCLALAQEALASVYWMTEDWQTGLVAYRAALALAVDCNHLELRVLCTMGLAATENGVACLAQEAGYAAQAEEGMRRSVQLQRAAGALAAELGDDYLAMYCVLNTGCSLHSLQAFDEARAVLQPCLADPRCEPVHAQVMSTLGRVAFDEGDLAGAQALLQRALQLTERLQKPFPMLVVLENLVDLHEALGDPAAALAHLRRFHALYVRNASEKARMRALAMTVMYETERALAVAEAQRERADRLERSNVDLAREAAQQTRVALLDGLTEVANRRRFDQALQALVQADGSLAPCSVALADIDHFKRVNDEFSHPVGDEVLRRVARLMQSMCRRNDLVARYGGEEFVLLTASDHPAEMQQVSERLRAAVAAEDWSALRPGLTVTLSIGVAHSHEVAAHNAPAEALLALADRRLYAAKHAGRNRVCDGIGST